MNISTILITKTTTILTTITKGLPVLLYTLLLSTGFFMQSTNAQLNKSTRNSLNITMDEAIMSQQNLVKDNQVQKKPIETLNKNELEYLVNK